MTKVPTPFKMSEAEVRARFAVVVKMFPFTRIAKMMKMRKYDLRRFLLGLPPRAILTEKVCLGPKRLMRLAKICLDIETGVIKKDPEVPLVFPYFSKGRKSKHTYDNPPDREPQPVHRVVFGQERPALLRQEAPKQQTMPSFKTLFGQENKGRDLSFLLKKR